MLRKLLLVGNGSDPTVLAPVEGFPKVLPSLTATYSLPPLLTVSPPPRVSVPAVPAPARIVPGLAPPVTVTGPAIVRGPRTTPPVEAVTGPVPVAEPVAFAASRVPAVT